MTTHNHRPMTHTEGLQDGCPRCAEHAEHPIRSLDDGNLLRLVELAIRPEPFLGVRGANEITALARVLDALYEAGPLVRIAPDLCIAYWRETWRAMV